MKNRILTYAIFGMLALLGIVLYFVNPNLVAFQVTMSFGASLIGAVFVAISLEAINMGKHKKGMETIQKYMLSSVKDSLVMFYSWYVAYLVKRYKIETLTLDASPKQLLEELFLSTRKQLDNNLASPDETYVISRMDAKLDNVIDAVEKLNRNLKKEMPTLITNDIIEQRDIDYFEKLLTQLNDTQLLDSLSERNTMLMEIIDSVSSNEMLNIKIDDILNERLKQKFIVKE